MGLVLLLSCILAGRLAQKSRSTIHCEMCEAHVGAWQDLADSDRNARSFEQEFNGATCVGPL